MHPTGVDTGMQPASLHSLLAETASGSGTGSSSMLPSALMAEAIDISNAVLFLSDESRFVTGLEFKVDAGVTIR